MLIAIVIVLVIVSVISLMWTDAISGTTWEEIENMMKSEE